MYNSILTDLREGILTVTINRPEKLNALNKEVLNELAQVVENIYRDNQIKAAIITGAGEKAFVAGADISEMLEIKAGDGASFAQRGQDIFSSIENCPKPVVAAVNGFALGGGCELAMACHFRIAAENAKFGQPEVNLGIIPGYGGTQRLTILVGKGKAMELMMTGSMISAEEARELGLVNYVTPADELLIKTTELLKKILEKSPVAISKVIGAVNAVFTSEDGFKEEIKLFAESFNSNDKEEGTKAFVEKRKPVFPGT